MLRKLLFGLGLALAVVAPLCAYAQQPVVTSPSGVTSLNASGTIAVTNTFQSVFTAGSTSAGGAGTRRSCLIMNTSANEQWVHFGSDTATKANSIPIDPPATLGHAGGYVTCANPGGTVAQDAISITGTAGDAFVALQE